MNLSRTVTHGWLLPWLKTTLLQRCFHQKRTLLSLHEYALSEQFDNIVKHVKMMFGIFRMPVACV